VNGDGYADVIVGARFSDTETFSGQAYLYYGGPGADAIADVTLTGSQGNDEFGVSVSDAGDVNGDGYGDVIVGASEASSQPFIENHAGQACVYYGGPGMEAVPDSARPKLSLQGTAGSHFGNSVSSAGDVNGDGYADVIVGALGSGQAYVFYGGPGADAVADLTLLGAAGDYFGQSVSSAGDVNGDGFADVIVGAYVNDAAGTDAGQAYVYYLGPVADAVADLTLTGAAAGDYFGITVASAGDVNGDGLADVIVGAYGNDEAADRAGRAYVFSVQASVLETTIDLNPNVINLKSHAPWLTAYIEPSGFSPIDIDISTLRLAGSVPAGPKFARVGDHDANGAPDLMVKFSRQALDPLLVGGLNQLEVSGSLVTGQQFKGSDEVSVIQPSGAHLMATVAPNPFNPVGILTFSTTRPDLVSIKVFDLQGRLVRTLIEAQPFAAGSHEVRMDGRGEAGQPLSSGVYFYRVETRDGNVMGRIAILK
jgi:hypothetical protein